MKDLMCQGKQLEAYHIPDKGPIDILSRRFTKSDFLKEKSHLGLGMGASGG
jgi:hypothetical protein